MKVSTNASSAKVFMRLVQQGMPIWKKMNVVKSEGGRKKMNVVKSSSVFKFKIMF
jgi:hypothetical protein